jgi:hypothetical protein
MLDITTIFMKGFQWPCYCFCFNHSALFLNLFLYTATVQSTPTSLIKTFEKIKLEQYKETNSKTKLNG